MSDELRPIWSTNCADCGRQINFDGTDLFAGVAWQRCADCRATRALAPIVSEDDDLEEPDDE